MRSRANKPPVPLHTWRFNPQRAVDLIIGKADESYRFEAQIMTFLFCIWLRLPGMRGKLRMIGAALPTELLLRQLFGARPKETLPLTRMLTTIASPWFIEFYSLCLIPMNAIGAAGQTPSRAMIARQFNSEAGLDHLRRDVGQFLSMTAATNRPMVTIEDIAYGLQNNIFGRPQDYYRSVGEKRAERQRRKKSAAVIGDKTIKKVCRERTRSYLLLHCLWPSLAPRLDLDETDRKYRNSHLVVRAATRSKSFDELRQALVKDLQNYGHMIHALRRAGLDTRRCIKVDEPDSGIRFPESGFSDHQMSLLLSRIKDWDAKQRHQARRSRARKRK